LDLRFWILDWAQKDKNMIKIFSIRFPAFSSSNRKSKRGPADDKRPRGLKWAALLTIAFVFAIGGAVVMAQQPMKIHRIGVLDASTASSSAAQWLAFREELSKLGWIEGKNIAIEYHFADLKSDRLPELAADLVRLKVDLIAVTAGPATAAARRRQLLFLS
jgi:hypothetical protein